MAEHQDQVTHGTRNAGAQLPTRSCQAEASVLPFGEQAEGSQRTQQPVKRWRVGACLSGDILERAGSLREPIRKAEFRRDVQRA
jgi:hypothetical protein